MISYQLLSWLTAALIVLSNVPPTCNTEVKDCRITFTIGNAGIDVIGTIDSADIRIARNGAKITSIDGVAYPASIRTGIAIRDQHLLRSDYFDVTRFPTISVSSHSIETTGRNTFAGLFDVTIKGVTKRISVYFLCTQTDTELTYKGTIDINRLDFSLGKESPILSSRVVVSVEIQTSR